MVPAGTREQSRKLDRKLDRHVTALVGEDSDEMEITQEKRQRGNRGQVIAHVDDTYAFEPFPQGYVVGRAPQ